MTKPEGITEVVVLKPDRDKPLRNRHPWVFLGAVASLPEFENGSLLPVTSTKGDFLGYGYFNKGQSIVGRMVSFTAGDPEEAVKSSIASAIAERAVSVPPQTTAYRLINGEGDNLPGLIVDVYDDVIVLLSDDVMIY